MSRKKRSANEVSPTNAGGAGEKAVGHLVPAWVLDGITAFAADQTVAVNRRFGIKDHVAGALFFWWKVVPAVVQLDAMFWALELQPYNEAFGQRLTEALLRGRHPQLLGQSGSLDSQGTGK